MKLSIIIPLYNKEEYIERCLKSLLNQDIVSNQYEIIIVDDGSTDTSAEIAQNYADNHFNIYCFRQKNRGVSAARNKGFEVSNGDYVYFLDADDYLASNVLNSVIALCEDNNLEILEFNSKEIKANDLEEIESKISEDLIVLSIDGLAYISEYGFRTQAWRFVVKRDLLIDNDIKFIEGVMYEDILFTASLFLKANKMAKLNLDVHRYVLVPNSINSNKNWNHQRDMSNSIIVIVEKFQDLIGSLDRSNLNYEHVVKRLKGRQQAMVFSLLLRTFRHQIYKIKDIDKILNNFENLKVYPMKTSIGGGMERGKSRLVLPIFNNKGLLYLALTMRKLIPFY